MAITSAGYEGTVNEPEWSDLLAMAGGRQYGVGGPGDWKVTPGVGADRQIQIAVGRGFGYGVRDLSDAVATLQLPAGERWHLITAHRDWQANQTTFAAISGGVEMQLPPRDTTPGTVDDQPLALVRVRAASQIALADIIDLRIWGGDGGALAMHELVLQFANRLGTRVRIGNREWSRVVDSLGSPAWAVTGTETRHNGNPGATLAGIDVPSGALLLPGAQIKTGMLTSGTTVAFGNEYMPAIVFEQPFPNGILSVSVLPVFAGIASPLSPPIAPGVDGVSRGGFRVMYPRSGEAWVRSFLWTAIGY
ncbi:MAG: hypothetical protein K0S37_2609 [Microbacterium sp.]|nr:hypothetical protein [Microbacterium sp.]